MNKAKSTIKYNIYEDKVVVMNVTDRHKYLGINENHNSEITMEILSKVNKYVDPGFIIEIQL